MTKECDDRFDIGGLAAFAVTPVERTKTIDDRYPDARPTRTEIRAHQEYGYVVSVRGVKSRESGGRDGPGAAGESLQGVLWTARLAGLRHYRERHEPLELAGELIHPVESG